MGCSSSQYILLKIVVFFRFPFPHSVGRLFDWLCYLFKKKKGDQEERKREKKHERKEKRKEKTYELVTVHTLVGCFTLFIRCVYTLLLYNMKYVYWWDSIKSMSNVDCKFQWNTINENQPKLQRFLFFRKRGIFVEWRWRVSS